jgi:hypothetical protein
MPDYWAVIYRGRKRVRKLAELGPFDNRDTALATALAYAKEQCPTSNRDILTGYGTNGAFFDIQWHRPHGGK